MKLMAINMVQKEIFPILRKLLYGIKTTEEEDDDDAKDYWKWFHRDQTFKEYGIVLPHLRSSFVAAPTHRSEKVQSQPDWEEARSNGFQDVEVEPCQVPGNHHYGVGDGEDDNGGSDGRAVRYAKF